MVPRPAAFLELSQGELERMNSKSRMLRPSWPEAVAPRPRRNMHVTDILDSSLIWKNTYLSEDIFLWWKSFEELLVS
jgi:hypothetical protein